MNENPYLMLAKYILPKEMYDYFDLVEVKEDEYDGEPRIHLSLDEKNVAPEGYDNLAPNGFFDPCCINDFPIRESVPYFISVVACGRIPRERVSAETGIWSQKASATLRSLRLF
jgi:hypothetical protein